jgi:hypothetical protein
VKDCDGKDGPEGKEGRGGLGYPEGHPVNKFDQPRVNLWGRFKIWTASIVHDLLTDPQINQEGLDFLQREFLHQ